MAAAVSFISALAPALTVAGTLMSFSSSMNRADAAMSAAQYNASVARSNAIATRQQGEANAAAQRRKARLAIGQARAGFGAAGVALEGSAIDVLEQSAVNAELDRQNILYGSESRASSYDAQAGMELWQGSQTASSARMEGYSALARGGAALAGMNLFGSSDGLDTRGGATGGGTDGTLRRMG